MNEILCISDTFTKWRIQKEKGRGRVSNEFVYLYKKLNYKKILKKIYVNL